VSPTIVPVDEIDTEFVSHPPRPLFPNVQDKLVPGGPPPAGAPMEYEDFDNMEFEDEITMEYEG